ncbi:MAG: hypothetical protein GX585_04120 [Clostridiales bacterium]|nr:hypothetical protein [Clostridiales bacterium]
MAERNMSRIRNEVIRCPNCGEDYSVTYKRCPFCEEEQVPRRARSSGGKGRRLQGSGGWSIGRVISTVLSLGLIVAAIVIVVTIVKPLIDRGAPAPVPTATPALEESPSPQATPTPPPSSAPSAAPEASGATGLTLDKTDFTLSRAGETYTITAILSPAGATGDVTWGSDKPGVASVSETGTVTAVAAGTATITATLPNGVTQSCTVRCSWSGGETYTTPGTAAVLSNEDVTLRRAGETFTLRVEGAAGTPAFATGNAAVATVSETGRVTAVAKGKTEIVVTVDGQKLICIVRCSF